MFKFSANASYNMPAHFGGLEGPMPSQTYHDVTTIMVAYETDGDMLARYLPECFTLLEPVVMVSFAANRRVDWLAGGGYDIVAVNVPVRYASASETIDGAYALVVWENRACPILGGREQTGMPKIFADISEISQYDETFFTHASYQNSTFLRFTFRREAQIGGGELDAVRKDNGAIAWFGWRYIPNIGRPGAALSHPTLYPVENIVDQAWRGGGSAEWLALSALQAPGQAHIIGALAAFPVKAWRPAMMTRGSQVLRIGGARQLDFSGSDGAAR